MKGPFPESFRCRMAKEDRGSKKEFMTQPECDAKWARGQERKLQEQMANLCRQRNLFFRQMPPHRKAPWPGWPDFIIVAHLFNPAYPNCAPIVLMVEAKAEGGKVSDDQLDFHKEFFDKTGHCIHVVWSLQQFQHLLDHHIP